MPAAADGAVATTSMGGVDGVHGAAVAAYMAAVRGLCERVDSVCSDPIWPRREIVAVWTPVSAPRGSGRVGGCQAVAHGHAGSGRSVGDGSVGR